MQPYSDVKKKPRAILTEQQAVEIFRLAFSHQDVESSATALATRYGVNERTVRDIWKQRTWNYATRPFEGNVQVVRSKKKVGRPKGSKDSKPRKSKQGYLSTSDSGRQAICSISQNMCISAVPTSVFMQCSTSAAVYTKIVGAECLRPETTFTELQLVSSPKESKNLPIDEVPYASDLEFLSENGSIDAVLHSWTLQRLPWIERAESYLRKRALRPA